MNEVDGEFGANGDRGNMLLNQINEILNPIFHYEASKFMLFALETFKIILKNKECDAEFNKVSCKS